MHQLGRHGVRPGHAQGDLLILSDAEAAQETVSWNLVDGKLKG